MKEENQAEELSSKKDLPEEKKKRFDEEWDYVGNIWGWKFSFISLGIILFMLALMTIRYYTMEPRTESPTQEQVINKDSLSQ